MGAQILDGKLIAQEIEKSLLHEVYSLREEHGIIPSLHVIVVGEDEGSKVYVRNKHKKCEKLGFASVIHRMAASTPEPELLEHIKALNSDKSVNGILVQLPLPSSIDSRRVMETINPLKDVDGFHPANLGALVISESPYPPCTPLGIMELLARTGVSLQGKNAAVIGRSAIVGKPVALMLLHENATVTMCHSKTEHLSDITKRADILIVAMGRQEFITGDFIKEGAVIIDVGINRAADGTLKGDVHFESASRKAAWITPVPGGVGPMTIIMLMRNTIRAARLQNL